MKIGVTGASGFVGKEFVHIASGEGHQVVAFSRNPARPIPDTVETREFRLHHAPEASGLDAVVHLAGENVMGLWTRKKKEAIMESRLLGTRKLVSALQAANPRPRVLVSASAVGYYGTSSELEFTEESPAGAGFLAEVSQAWEAEAELARQSGIRVAIIRIGFVLGKDSGAMRLIEPVFKAGLGGQLGNGQQWMSWIHVADVARIFLRAVTDETIAGVWNATAPNPVRNSEFTAEVAKAVHRPAIFGAPSFALRLALGELSSVLVEGQRVLPQRPLEHGFEFLYPDLPQALSACL